MRPLSLLVFLSLLGACTSSADLEAQFQRGVKSARNDDCKTAIADLEPFTAKACAQTQADRHCREGYLALGRCYERRATPAEAWVAFDRALALPPHARDSAVRDDLARAQQEIADQPADKGSVGPVIIRYRDEVTDEYTPRRVLVSIDFEPVYTKEKDAAELRSPEFTKIFGGAVSAGTHVLVVEAAHGCKPTEGVRCGASLAHRSWTFQSIAKTPLILEVRTYAEPGQGGAPATPTLDMNVH